MIAKKTIEWKPEKILKCTVSSGANPQTILGRKAMESIAALMECIKII